jgi:hypothetical protein
MNHNNEPLVESRTEAAAATHARQTPAALIVAAWLFVGIPLLWGVSQTFIKSLDLFRGHG